MLYPKRFDRYLNMTQKNWLSTTCNKIIYKLFKNKKKNLCILLQYIERTINPMTDNDLF